MDVSYTLEMIWQCLQTLCAALQLQIQGDNHDLLKICSDYDEFDPIMARDFARVLKRSRYLPQLSKSVFALQTFSPAEVQRQILDAYGVQTYPRRLPTHHQETLLMSNMAQCLQSLLVVNSAYTQLSHLRDTVFSHQNAGHTRMLQEIYQSLLPEETNIDWGNIGFQGKDPASDFRGMGLLGLVQLHYFSTQCTLQARDVLNMSNDSSRAYFPFAATSINVTAFVLALFQEQRLHTHLFVHLADVSSEDDLVSPLHLVHPESGSSGPSSSSSSAATRHAVEQIHLLYIDIYLHFAEVWRLERPRDLMCFPAIWQRIQTEFRTRYPVLEQVPTTRCGSSVHPTTLCSAPNAFAYTAVSTA